MSILDASLRKTWDSLRAKKQVQEDFLDEVRLKGLRGIRNLRVVFDYPVSVIAGPNGCGKSTVLFACAAAYAPAGRSARADTPAALFPGFSNGGEGGFVDEAGGTGLEFYYLAAGVRYSMVWRKGRSWSRSYMGRKDARQPARELYLRTLANLTNPSEVRGLLQLGRGTFDAEEITPDLLLFARRILPQKYRGVSLLRARNRDLLFAGLEHDNAVRYSEFHMSAGERAILRMSKDVSSPKRALVRAMACEGALAADVLGRYRRREGIHWRGVQGGEVRTGSRRVGSVLVRGDVQGGLPDGVSAVFHTVYQNCGRPVRDMEFGVQETR